MNFTAAQQAAIDDRSGSLLISAGAGSGKTAVLTTRLISRLTDPDDSAEITDFLVVTFTRAAAKELRERLRSKLTEAIAADPGNKKVLRQLAKLPLAHISTIHSFCLDLVSRHFQELGLPPKLRIGDDAETSILCQEILLSLIEEKHDATEGETRFLKAVEAFSGSKSDRNFLDTLLSLYRKLRNFPDPFQWFDVVIDQYKSVIGCTEYLETEFGNITKSALQKEIELGCITLKRAIEDMSGDAVLEQNYLPAFEADIAFYRSLFSQIQQGYEKTREVLLSFSSAKVSSIRNYEDKEFLEQLRKTKNDVAKDIKDCTKRFFSATKQKLDAAALETIDLLNEVKELLILLDKRFAEQKLERGILDYGDLECFTLKLLVEHINADGSFKRTELAKSLSYEIKEIYIDEYQDINPVQDMIFSALARKKVVNDPPDTETTIQVTDDTSEEQNRFMVGDIKQSIYRFRGARPDIFRTYKDTFHDLGDQETTRHKLYLSDNFRCAEPVIRLVNGIFGKLMPDLYSDEDALRYAKKEEVKITAPTELILISPETDLDEVDNNLPPFTKEEIEAKVIAGRIKELVGRSDILGSDGKPYRYGDVCILMRSTSETADHYVKMLEREGIPAVSAVSENFFEKREVLLALCLFHAVDNPERDIYLAGLMHSPLFGFTADEMVRLRKDTRDTSFYRSVCLYAERTPADDLSNKAANFLQTLAEYRKLSRGLPADQLLWKLFHDTFLLGLCASESFGNRSPEEGEARRRNLMLLYEYARTFEKSSVRGLSAYLQFLKDLAENKKSEKEAGEGNEDRVTVMSIHRSKGLEFPICFVAGLAKQFNTTDEKNILVLDDTFGIGLKLRDAPGNLFSETQSGLLSVDTPFRQAVISAVNTASRDEEKRILYVALTRAKDRLILTACNKKPEKLLTDAYRNFKDGPDHISLVARTPIEWVLNTLAGEVAAKDLYADLDIDLPPLEHNIGEDVLACHYIKPNFKPEPFYKKQENSENTPLDEEKARAYHAEIARHFAFHYPYLQLCSIPAKLTVSQLKIGLIDEENNSDDTRHKPEVKGKELPDFLRESKQKPDSAERGTALHLFMQFANYTNAEENGAEREAERLVTRGFIDKSHFDLLDFSTLDGFFRSSFYAQMKQGKNIKREMRFNLRIPVSEFFKKENALYDDEFVLVQGVIDCFYENHDGSYTVVDFKTDKVSEEDGEEILRLRHGEQLRYYCRAVREMTGKEVTHGILYSFSLKRPIEVALS